MRTTAFIAGVLSCALLSVMNTGHAKAESLDYLIADASPRITKELTMLGIDQDSQDKTDNDLKTKDDKDDEAKKEPVIKHTVLKSESLTKIAKQYDTTWQRLFAKNKSIINPDKLDVGLEIIVPASDEELAERAAPQPVIAAVQAPAQPAQAPSQPVTSQPVATQPRASVGGNTYYQGYCTWYVKNRRPDLPNNLGNADTWAYRAAAQGIPTGSVPRVGAVGQQGMHVVYVESVNGDGTVTVSEMNYKGWNITSSRTVAASNFRYIY